MPIEIYTGKPGNGKTALMVERLMNEAQKAERPLFQAGIDGLRPGLATALGDPRNWNVQGSPDYVPDGALVFVDEAWKWFGHLHDASRQATPPHVLALAEHRHRGIDFVWTAQGPNQLYPFSRPLIADHRHVVRRFGTSLIDVYHWEELQDDVKSTAKRELARRSTVTLPEKTFGVYKSAEIHTIKRKIPKRLYALAAIPLLLAAAVYAAYATLRPDAHVERMTGRSAALAAPAPGIVATATAPESTDPMTAEAWAARFLPRIAVYPQSAPAYDDRPVQSVPQLACAIGERMGCRCLTEQGTRYEIDQFDCVAMVNNGGVYDPFKAPPQQAMVQQPADLPSAPADELAAAAGTGVGNAADLQSSYGDFRR